MTIEAATDRRAQLIEAAHRVIARRGFPAATTRAMARMCPRAKKSPPQAVKSSSSIPG